MINRLLYVDDEPSIRLLVKEQFSGELEVETAANAEEGLDALQTRGPFAVVLSDMRMPGDNGIEFLRKAQGIAPESVRMLITAHADLTVALDAVNTGNVFRLLSKPCSRSNLLAAVRAAVQQYHLVVSQRELLEKTLAGSMRVLTEVLSVVDPAGFGRGLRMKRPMWLLTRALGLSRSWELDVATMLSQLGRVGAPDELLARADAGQPLGEAERRIVEEAPELAARLLGHIPRLELVARIVRYQNKNFDGTGLPEDAVSGEEIPLGSRMLRVVTDLAVLQSRGLDRRAAFERLRQRAGCYDARVLQAAESVLGGDSSEQLSKLSQTTIRLGDLSVGHVLIEDVAALNGHLLLSAGTEITATNLERLRIFGRLNSIREPITVKCA